MKGVRAVFHRPHPQKETDLAFCAQRKESPEKPFSGTLSLRLPPEIHRRIALEAGRHSKSLNAYILDRLRATAGANSLPAGVRRYARMNLSPP